MRKNNQTNPETFWAIARTKSRYVITKTIQKDMISTNNTLLRRHEFGRSPIRQKKMTSLSVKKQNLRTYIQIPVLKSLYTIKNFSGCRKKRPSRY